MAYRFIQKYSYLFGVRWLLRRLKYKGNIKKSQTSKSISDCSGIVEL